MGQMAPESQAIVLLTAHFGSGAPSSAAGTGAPSPRWKPLTAAEWGRFALWLRSQRVGPERLLEPDAGEFMRSWQDARGTVSAERVSGLLGRSAAFAFCVEQWERAGLWLLTRADADYPQRLKARLGMAAPPLFFGCGPRALLAESGVAVVGSRDAGEEDLAWAAALGAEASRRTIVVSGGARGVDAAAVGGALDAGGAALVVLADSLLRATTQSRNREAILQERLTLVSPFAPEAGFDVGNAFARNKYIYCLSSVAVVVTSGAENGGTKAGAEEDLRHSWVPLYVRASGSPVDGNRRLLDLGARPIDGPEEIVPIFERCREESARTNASAGGGEGLVAEGGAPISTPANGEPQFARPNARTRVDSAEESLASPAPPRGRRRAKPTPPEQASLDLGLEPPPSGPSKLRGGRKSAAPKAMRKATKKAVSPRSGAKPRSKSGRRKARKAGPGSDGRS